MTDTTVRGAGPAARAHHAGGDGQRRSGAGACRPSASRARCCGCCGAKIWSCCRASPASMVSRRQAGSAFVREPEGNGCVERFIYQTPAAVRAAQLVPLPVAA
jgi:hypothetical protein